MIHKQQITHRVQFNLAVTEIRIEIRFPCKLQIGVKIGKQQTNTIQEVQLKSGLASFGQEIKAEALISYDQTLRKYLEKKSNITVYVVSPRGKNVAGVYPLDLSNVMNNSIQQMTIVSDKLQRCPDREATISLKARGYLIEQLIDANVSMASDRSGQYLQSASKLNSISRLQSRYNAERLENQLSEKKLDRNQSQKHKRSLVQETNSPFHQRLLDNRSDTGSRPYKKQQSGFELESFKSKHKFDDLQQQVQILRRQLVEKKRLQSEVDQLGYKVTEMQKVINGNKIQIDSSNKRKKTDIIESNNKIQQLEKLNLTLQKRLDIKGTFYKQELQKYNAKLISIENQKQQFIVQISALKDQNFDLNRKINSLKDKEKILNDDKAKLTKRIEDMKKQTVDKSEINVTGSARDVMYERLRQTISNNQLQKISLLDELEKLKNQMLNEGIFRTKYQQELKQKNNLIQQKIFYESQNSLIVEQSKSQILRLNKQLTERTDQIHILNSRIIEITSKNKTEVGRLMENIEEIKNTLEFVRQTEEKGRVEYQDLSYAFQQNQRQLQENYKRSSGLQTIIKQSKQQNDTLMKNLNKSVEQSKRLHNQIQRLKQFIDGMQRQFSSQNDSKRQTQFSLKTQVQKLQSSNKQLQQQLSITSQQLSLLKTQSGEQDNNFTQQLQRKDRLIKQKQEEIRSIYEEETNLQIRNGELESKLADEREKSKVLEGELLKQRTIVESLKRTNAVLEESQQELKRVLRQIKNSLEQKQNQCDSLIESNKLVEAFANQTRVEFDEYQQNTHKHINSLLKSLVTRSKTQQLFILPQLSQGLIKLQTDVIQKVKNAYEQLESTSQKLLNIEMESIGISQNSNLQLQTMEIQITQLKKQLLLSKEEKNYLTTNIESNKQTFHSENESLKSKIKQQQIELQQSYSLQLKQQSASHQSVISRLQLQYSTKHDQLQSKVNELQQQFSNAQKELYDQYNQVNVMTLKNYQLGQQVKQLQERLQHTGSNQHIWMQERGKLINDIIYLEQELRKLGQIYEVVSRNYFVAMERQVVLVGENQYLRKQFSNDGGKDADLSLQNSSSFHDRENNIIQMHRISSQNKQLNDIIFQLQKRVHEKDTAISHLQQNIKVLGLQVEDKYRIIYELENQIKQTKSKFKQRSRNNISKMSGDANSPTLKSKISL